MHAHNNEKPHGNFPLQAERGGYLIREPKGDPDVLLFCEADLQSVLLSAANILSVQGITARMVIINDINIFLSQPADYQNGLFSENPRIKLGIFSDIDAAKQITEHAILFSGSTTPTEVAQTAVRKFYEHN